MKHRIMILAVFLCLVLSLSTHITATPDETPSAFKKEMLEARQRESADLRQLVTRIEATNDRLEILDLQREMADRKIETEIELLEIRGQYAKDEGRAGRAEDFERAVTRLRAVLAEGSLEGRDRP